MGEAVYPVPAEWARDALVDEARYNDMYRQSVENPQNREVAEDVVGATNPNPARNGSIHRRR